MQGLGTALPVNFDYGGFWTVFACVDPFFALGNNIRGQVVGYNGELATFQWAFSWTPAQGMTYAFGGDPATSANAVSNTGQIVGQYGYYSLPWPGHAITVNKGVTTDLGTLSAEPDPYFIFSSSANGVNDLGQIVGWSDVPDLVPFFHAVLWAPTEEIRDLGTLPGDTLSDALKINFFGKVIGISGNTEVPTLYDASGDLALSKGVSGRPFIWSDRNGMQDLNTLIPTDSGWTLNSVADINVWGQIVGTGTLNGQPHGFLLTPKSFF
jgi:probable HAF family extracellular repeat protein